MNLSRKLAEILTSSSAKCLLHPIVVLQISPLSSTTSTTKQRYSRKQPKSGPLISESKDPPPPPPLPPPEPTTAEALPSHDDLGFLTDSKPPPKVVKNHTQWPRPSKIPWQAKVSNSVNLIGSVTVPVQFQASPDGKYWAGTILTQEQTPGFTSLWIPVIFEGDLAHIATCHLKEKDIIHVAGQLSGDPPQVTMEQGQSNIQVMVHSLNFVHESNSGKESHSSFKQAKKLKDVEFSAGDWRDLFDNPDHWLDHRKKKLNGLVNPKYPDFKHKDRGQPLWLSSAPKWVLSKLEELVFDGDEKIQCKGKGSYQSNIKSGEESWKNLVENPDNWRDNRFNKINQKFPDFKHKVTGEALWLDSAPAWVLPKFGGTKPTDVAVGEEHWKNLIENPDNWWDNRSSKLNIKSPDFKHKLTGEGLWLDKVPSWVSPKLPPIKSTDAAVGIGKQSWKNLIENPDDWLDNRSNKKTEKYPDFTHKITGDGLWVDSAPVWVLPKLPLEKSTGVPVWKRDTLLS